jgi:DNA-binding response OmpR family regulator
MVLLDDDPGFLTALTQLPTKHGYAVSTADSAVEAMTNDEQEFDLMIIDLSIPKL